MKKFSIHIGMNQVNSEFYSGWDGFLSGPINDAYAMADIAAGCMYNNIQILENASEIDFINKIELAAGVLEKGDILLLTYSGHGGQVPDVNNDELDGLDETWCLFDGMFTDDDLYYAFTKFREGVQIIVVSDSCHSGTITKAQSTHFFIQKELGYKTKSMPLHVSFEAYYKHKHSYFKENRGHRSTSKLPQGTGVITLSACQDNQYAYDGSPNSLFTEMLIACWPNSDNYIDLISSIRKLIPAAFGQTPRLSSRHVKLKNLSLLRPFDHTK